MSALESGRFTEVILAVDGVVDRVAISATQQVEAGDLLVVIRPAQ